MSIKQKVEGPIGQLRDFHGGWGPLVKASGISQRTWTRWARGVQPQGWNARILVQLFREAGIESPWLSPALNHVIEEYRHGQTA